MSSGGGEEPRWGPDSKELFYGQGHRLMRVALRTTPQLGVSKPETLFERRYRRVTASPGFTSYSVARDGQRFLMIKPGDSGAGLTKLTVVLGGSEAWERHAR